MSELPEGWADAKLGDIAENLDGRRVPVNSKERSKRPGTVPYYGATGQVGWIDRPLFCEELLLLGEDGAPFLDASKSVSYIVTGPSWVNNHAHVLQARQEVTTNRFLKYALDATDFSPFVSGSTRLKLTQAAMNSIPVPIPPLAEQRRIVDKVEALLAQTSKATANLTNVKTVLATCRASMLSAAVSGKLTAEWASAVLPEEERQWTAHLLGEMFDVATGATPLRKNRSYYEGGTVPWVKSGAVNDGEITAADEFITPLALRETNAKLFNAGTLLVAMYGEGATRGKIAELRIDAATNQALAAILFDQSNESLRGFLRLIFEAQYHKVRAESAGGVQPNLSLEMIRSMSLRVPGERERTEIERRTALMTALLRKIQARIENALTHSARLSQSILAKAFAGELVPTEAELARRDGRSYEPASVLLERIRAERASTLAAPKRRRQAATSASRGARSPRR